MITRDTINPYGSLCGFAADVLRKGTHAVTKKLKATVLDSGDATVETALSAIIHGGVGMAGEVRREVRIAVKELGGGLVECAVHPVDTLKYIFMDGKAFETGNSKNPIRTLLDRIGKKVITILDGSGSHP